MDEPTDTLSDNGAAASTAIDQPLFDFCHGLIKNEIEIPPGHF